MFFTLQPPVIQINVSRIANLQYFEFSDAFHSMQDRHNFCELLYVDKGSLSILRKIIRVFWGKIRCSSTGPTSYIPLPPTMPLRPM